MNAKDNESLVYDEYDYDICDLDPNPEFPHGSVILLVLLFGLGLLGNSLVLWVLVRHVKLKTMTDICLLNLAVSDLLLAVSLPFWTYSSQNLPTCKMITTVYQLGFYSGTLFVTLMSVDRYLAIVHAVAAMRTRKLRYGITASMIVWAISTIMMIPQVMFATLERDESGNGSKCQPFYPEDNQLFWKMRRNFSENTVGLFVSLPIMIFCYVKILMVLSKSRNSKKNKAVKLIFILVCLFVVCWVPYNVIVFLETLELLGVLNSCMASKTINTARSFAEIIALAHCCVNPVIYAFVGEKFRKSLGGMLSKYLGWRYNTGTASSRDTTDRETSNTPVRSDY